MGKLSQLASGTDLNTLFHPFKWNLSQLSQHQLIKCCTAISYPQAHDLSTIFKNLWITLSNSYPQLYGVTA